MSDIRRPKDYEEMLYDLCQSDNKIFLSYKDALVFAACLGFDKKTKKHFTKTSEPVGIHIFKGEYDNAVFHCIGLCETKDPLIMSSEKLDERIQLFEEYAAGGLEIIKARIYDSPGDWEGALTSLIFEFEGHENKILNDITSMAD